MLALAGSLDQFEHLGFLGRLELLLLVRFAEVCLLLELPNLGAQLLELDVDLGLLALDLLLLSLLDNLLLLLLLTLLALGRGLLVLGSCLLLFLLLLAALLLFFGLETGFFLLAGLLLLHLLPKTLFLGLLFARGHALGRLFQIGPTGSRLSLSCEPSLLTLWGFQNVEASE